MFTSVSHRSASAYQRVNVETAVSGASPHQLINMLFDALLQSLGMAQAAIKQGNTAVKCGQISKAVRIIDEGLKSTLNLEQGGDLSANLNGLYGYCVLRLTQANLNNDEAAVAEVVRVIEPIASGWKQIASQVHA